MDVTAATLEKLSFARVQEALSERAATFMGVERARALVPYASTQEADRALERVDEIVQGGDLALGGIEDVRPFLRRVREGNLLEGSEILSVAYTLDG
ncbi:MAG: endonuclease MutS2, partial [Trueperaceae bacterium]